MKGVVFDVDNTLYDSRQYFLGAFEKVSIYLSDKYHIKKKQVITDLLKILDKKTSMYPYLFDDFLKKYKIDEDIKTIVDIFNLYDGNLKPYDDIIPLLKKLKDYNYKLGIITDGNAKRQKAKIRMLKITDFFDCILYTQALGYSKPSQIPFKKIIKKLKINPNKTFYIGDNPVLDFEGAKKSGMTTIRILKGEFKYLKSSKYIDFETDDFKDMLKIIIKEVE